MIKNIDWLYCEKCNGKSPIKIESNVDCTDLLLCYEGDNATCIDCGAVGEIWVDSGDNPPTAHITWE